MTLQFIRGIGDADLEQPLIEEALSWLHHQEKREVFYLVPNHIKFEQEMSVLSKLKKMEGRQETTFASTRLQVFSFYRLAWFFLQHTPYYQTTTLSDAGLAMILRKVMREIETGLTVYRGEISQTGFIEQLIDLFKEFKEGNIQVDFLEKWYENKDVNDPQTYEFTNKVHDIALIFSRLEERLAHFEVKSSDTLDLLSSYLQTQDLSHVMFIVTGYDYFTARELGLLNILMQQGGAFKISLMLDKSYATSQPETMDLFHQTGTTYHQLYQLARKAHIAVLPDRVISRDMKQDQSVLSSVSKIWQQIQQNKPRQFHKLDQSEHYQLWCAENPKEEINHIAKEIRRLIIEEQYRYKDIQIVTRDLDSYEANLIPIFAQHDIPIYLDRDMSMTQHPLVEFIHALFSIETYYYRYRDVFRLLRTELFFSHENHLDLYEWQMSRNKWRDQIDQTENIVLAYGFEGAAWEKKQDWQFSKYHFSTQAREEILVLEQTANHIRRLIQQTLPIFFKKLKASKNGREAATIFYHFLIDIGAEKQLKMWIAQATEKGELEEATNHEQTWHAFVQLLDEYVLIYGDTPFDHVEFKEIFSSGLENLRYSKVPTAIDQVQVKLLDSVRPRQAKIIFALGMTDKTLPRTFENTTLFSDEDRQLFSQSLSETQFLHQDTRKQLSKEPFLAYLLFNAALERLYITYSKTQDTTYDMKLSPYISLISQHVSLDIQQKQSVKLTDSEQVSLQHVGTYRSLIGDLTNLERQTNEHQQSLTNFWQQLKNALLQQPDYTVLAQRVLASVSDQNIPVFLEPSVAEAIYGKALYTSVSQMESFYRCQYQYFARYGLNLQERTLFQLSPAATGEFYHEALDQLFQTMLTNQLQLTQLNPEELNLLTDQVLSSVLSEDRFAILHASNRMGYIRYQLEKTIKKVSWALKQQSLRSGLTAVQTEVLFGQFAAQKSLPGLSFELDQSSAIHVRGKIDRIDQIQTEKDLYLGVVDYKSSHKKFNIAEAYYGIAMQMITYLDVALMESVQLVGKKAKAVGSMYMHIHNPVLPYKKGQNAEQQILKKFQYDGLLVNDPEMLSQLDMQLERSQSSLIFPIKQSAKELIGPGIRQTDKFVEEKELATLIQHNRHIIVQAGNQIVNGSIQLNPAYQGKERIACRHCPFRSVCKFDVMLKENEYHRLQHLSKSDVMNRITTEEGVDTE